eukprot:CAMPEP_0115160986 /NCGR_PEP_ID=MMETSP0227-20121206/71103_1 /TAXON_ID=89957 /ORGANISM="Polarella glacialis, Strain CCMP 1383" /LENGTH=123 /DNA_ID=CAMNT_0002572931 /DNA_START=158 /DNA_END=529 /DNA_ORIENTATION=+
MTVCPDAGWEVDTLVDAEVADVEGATVLGAPVLVSVTLVPDDAEVVAAAVVVVRPCVLVVNVVSSDSSVDLSAKELVVVGTTVVLRRLLETSIPAMFTVSFGGPFPTSAAQVKLVKFTIVRSE